MGRDHFDGAVPMGLALVLVGAELVVVTLTLAAYEGRGGITAGAGLLCQGAEFTEGALLPAVALLVVLVLAMVFAGTL